MAGGEEETKKEEATKKEEEKKPVEEEKKEAKKEEEKEEEKPGEEEEKPGEEEEKKEAEEEEEKKEEEKPGEEEEKKEEEATKKEEEEKEEEEATKKEEEEKKEKDEKKEEEKKEEDKPVEQSEEEKLLLLTENIIRKIYEKKDSSGRSIVPEKIDSFVNLINKISVEKQSEELDNMVDEIVGAICGTLKEEGYLKNFQSDEKKIEIVKQIIDIVRILTIKRIKEKFPDLTDDNKEEMQKFAEKSIFIKRHLSKALIKRFTINSKEGNIEEIVTNSIKELDDPVLLLSKGIYDIKQKEEETLKRVGDFLNNNKAHSTNKNTGKNELSGNNNEVKDETNFNISGIVKPLAMLTATLGGCALCPIFVPIMIFFFLNKVSSLKEADVSFSSKKAVNFFVNAEEIRRKKNTPNVTDIPR